jgi:hypothetical protein
VANGASVTVNATVVAPLTAGDYTVRWDVIDMGIPSWFSALGVTGKSMSVSVADTGTAAYGITWGSSTLVSSLGVGETSAVQVTLTNSGSKTWEAGTFYVSYHVHNAAGGYVGTGGWTPLTSAVANGASVTVNATVIAPLTAGDYTVRWDVIDMGIPSWFSALGVTLLSDGITVGSSSGNSNPTPTPTPTPVPQWSGIHNTGSAYSGQYFNLGSGTMTWTNDGTDMGFFYAGGSVMGLLPDVSIANAVAGSACKSWKSGYQGPQSLSALTNLSSLTYTSQKVLFGTRESGCNTGLLVFKQGNKYGIVDFKEMVGNYLIIEYWVGDEGVTDFSKAPTGS